MKKTLYSTTALAAAGLLTFGASDAFAQAAAPAAPQKPQMAIGGFFTAYAGYASNSTKASTDSGITANYNGHDVRQVSIRGVGPDLNAVTMDGLQVASAQSANGGRAFEFDQASLGNIETIEVTKAPTPDMDGASIGGSVNLVTKSAFDRAVPRVFTYTLGFITRPTYKASAPTWKAPVEGFGPSMNFSYSDVYGEKRNIGITLTGTVHSQPGAGSTTLAKFNNVFDANAMIFPWSEDAFTFCGSDIFTSYKTSSTKDVDYFH